MSNVVQSNQKKLFESKNKVRPVRIELTTSGCLICDYETDALPTELRPQLELSLKNTVLYLLEAMIGIMVTQEETNLPFTTLNFSH
jgi:hypothetical protein